MVRFVLSLILALTLAVTASAGHGHNNVQAIIIQKNVQPRRVTPFRRNDVIVQKQIIVDNGHNQNFRQQQRVVYVPAQQFQQQYVASQQLNDCPCQNDGQLQFRQNLGGGCSSLYR